MKGEKWKENIHSKWHNKEEYQVGEDKIIDLWQKALLKTKELYKGVLSSWNSDKYQP